MLDDWLARPIAVAPNAAAITDFMVPVVAICLMSDVTRILCDLRRGARNSSEEMLILVYDELRRLAAARLAKERSDVSLQATGLVHEAYVRLVDSDQVQHWETRGHFFSAAAEAMRRILVERARKRRAGKRGGSRHRLDLDLERIGGASSDREDELLALNEALEMLSQHDPQAHQLVMLRYFGGLGHGEAAAAIGIGRREADRLWAIARVWLLREVRGESPAN